MCSLFCKGHKSTKFDFLAILYYRRKMHETQTTRQDDSKVPRSLSAFIILPQVFFPETDEETQHGTSRVFVISSRASLAVGLLHFIAGYLVNSFLIIIHFI